MNFATFGHSDTGVLTKVLYCLLVSLLASVWSQELPSLSQDLCSLDEVFDTIRTGKVVETTLVVRKRYCPSNRNNQPCGVQGYPGPMLDGVRATVITMNDQSPGPVIRANLGDTVRVHVVNYLSEPTTIHWHGISQFRNPWMNGDSTISDCPIAQGHNFTYEFVAHPAGTTWYSSHYGSQRADGMHGALIIRDPATEGASNDMQDKVVLFADWMHQPADVIQYTYIQNTPGACVVFGGPRFSGAINPAAVPRFIGVPLSEGAFFQSALVNGKGYYDYAGTRIPVDPNFFCVGGTGLPEQCEYCINPLNLLAPPILCSNSSANSWCGQIEIITINPGQQARLRFIHAGYEPFQVCIDGHPVKIIAVDGSPVEPFDVDCFIYHPAQRYDVLVDASKPAGEYAIRFTSLDQKVLKDWGTVDDFGPDTVGLPKQALAILRYGQSSGSFNTNYIACGGSITRNCGNQYWKTSVTLGCAMEVVNANPSRCKSLFQLKGLPSADQNICTKDGKKIAHQVKPTVRLTVKLSFLPDQVPRVRNRALNSRMEILPEDKFGYPVTEKSADPKSWQPRQPISFVDPPHSPLGLPREETNKIYNQFIQFNDASDLGLGPNSNTPYPPNFANGLQGTNAIHVNYGDVIQMFINCTEPYGPGCAIIHPLYLQGHKMAVLYAGAWNEKYDESKFNTVNPIYVDTATVFTDSFVVLQFVANNPGVWRFHCHSILRQRTGMSFLFDVGGESSAAMAVRQVPPEKSACMHPEMERYSIASSLSLLVVNLWVLFVWLLR